MFESMRKAILALVAMGSKRSAERAARQLQAIVARMLSDPSKAMQNIEAMDAMFARHALVAGRWVEPSDVLEGKGGAFDSCDLRHWLALAERAGVPFIPARQVLELDEREMNVLSGKQEMPDGPMARGIRRRAEKVPELMELAKSLPPDDEPEIDMESLIERLYAAMDDVPEGWMVRTNLGGTEELKAWAGAGVIDPGQAPGATFGPEIEVGPGWVRDGNRRRVRPEDSRTVLLAARGAGGAAFLARPWMKAGRTYVGEDPHRHGSMFAGKGIWPCEWRVFIERGKVVGVANYYAWNGEANAENAEMAFAARDLAQRIADEAVRTGAVPQFMDIELVRDGKLSEDPAARRLLDKFGADQVSGTLDFMETENGLMLLEGGPPHTPFGGAHPCAFAGHGGAPGFPNGTKVEGIAFRLMPGISLADPRTWREGDPAGCILPWDEAADLRRRPTP